MATAPGGGSFTGKYGTYKYAQPGTLHLPDVVPDYSKLIQQNAGYQGWESGRDLAIGNAGANRRAAIRTLALNYGGLPAGISDPYGDLDPATAALAKNNPESQQAQLQRNFGSQQEAMQRSLAARGALHSGDLVQGQSQLDQGLQDSIYGAGQALGTGLNQAVGDYRDAYTNAWSGQGAALTAAGTQEAALHPTQEGAAATLDPNWVKNYGQPVYTGPGGKLYTVGTDGGLIPYQRPVDTGAPGGPGGTPAPGGTPQTAAQLYAAGQHQQAITQWMANHPGAALGKATNVPSWVQAAVRAAIAARKAA